jgi:hypothetical protein
VNDAPVVTKLRAPRARPNLVARPRPPEGLGREPRRRLTLPSAPAGFGKTTLLVVWLWGRAGGGPSVAWLSLDGGDNDPARFLFYLVAALKTIEEGVGDGVLASLRSPEPPPIEAVVGALINELAAIPRDVVVVFDDLHAIDAEPVHRAVAFLPEHLPDGHELVRVDDPPRDRLELFVFHHHILERPASASCNERTTSAPSPTADATRFVDPLRTSPMAKTSGRVVSRSNGWPPLPSRCSVKLG